MSIQSEINRISGNVSDALDEIADKGVTVPAGANSDDLAGLIAQISSGGSKYPTFTVRRNAYGTITAITCDKPFAQCLDLADNGDGAAVVAFLDLYGEPAGSIGAYGWSDYDDQFYIVYESGGALFDNGALVNIRFNADGTLETVPVEGGFVYDPVATKGAVSNHAVTVTPSVAFDGGFIAGGSKTGTPVTVSASELVSGNKEITANGNNIDVAEFSTVSVAVPSGGSGKNAQIAPGFGRVNTTSYSAVEGQSITVAKTGTYHVYWTGYRSSTSGTNGTCLYVGNSAHTSGNQTTFDGTLTNCQSVHLTNVSLTQGQTISVRARARGTQYYMYVFGLTIIEA